MVVETRLNDFSRDLSKVFSIKKTLQQLVMNWQFNNRFFVEAVKLPEIWRYVMAMRNPTQMLFCQFRFTNDSFISERDLAV